jgi:curved DNA-binding protein CbpA
VADAYEILGLTRNSSEADIRQRYLELVRQYPPEQAPERFAAIRKAYEQLRDPVERLRAILFDVGGDDSMPAILADVRRRLRSARIPTQVLLSLAERS